MTSTSWSAKIAFKNTSWRCFLNILSTFIQSLRTISVQTLRTRHVSKDPRWKKESICNEIVSTVQYQQKLTIKVMKAASKPLMSCLMMMSYKLFANAQSAYYSLRKCQAWSKPWKTFLWMTSNFRTILKATLMMKRRRKSTILPHLLTEHIKLSRRS